MEGYGSEVTKDDQKIKASTPTSTSATDSTRPLLPGSRANSWRYETFLRGMPRSTSTPKKQELPGASTAIEEVSVLGTAVEAKQRLSSINVQSWSKDTVIKYFDLKDCFLDKSDFLWEENSSPISPASLVKEASREDIHVASPPDGAEGAIRGCQMGSERKRLISSSSSFERQVPSRLFAETLPTLKKQCTEKRIEIEELFPIFFVRCLAFTKNFFPEFGSEGSMALQQSEKQPGQLIREGKPVHKHQKRKRSCSWSFPPEFHSKKRCTEITEEIDEQFEKQPQGSGSEMLLTQGPDEQTSRGGEELRGRKDEPMREEHPIHEKHPLPSEHPVTFEEQPVQEEQPVMLEKHSVLEEQQHEDQTMRSENPTSTVINVPEIVRTCLRKVIGTSDFSNVLYDQFARGMLSSTDLERTICGCLHKISQFNMSDIQHIVRTIKLTTFSDHAEITRSLLRVAITHSVQENLLLKEMERLGNEVRFLKNACRLHAPTTPVRSSIGRALKYENLRKMYVLEYRKPFKAMNLNFFLQHHIEVAEEASNTFDEITCFLRSLSRRYATPTHQTFGDTRFDFIVEALGLGQEDLSSCRFEDLKCSDNRFWLSLGSSEEDREHRFRRLLKAKCDWTQISKVCTSNALDLVRSYCMIEGRLIPAKKDEVGLLWTDKQAMTPEAWRELREAVPVDKLFSS